MIMPGPETFDRVEYRGEPAPSPIVATLAGGLLREGWPEAKAARLAARAEAAAAEHGAEPADELAVIVRELWALSGADPRNPENA